MRSFSWHQIAFSIHQFSLHQVKCVPFYHILTKCIPSISYKTSFIENNDDPLLFSGVNPSHLFYSDHLFCWSQFRFEMPITIHFPPTSFRQANKFWTSDHQWPTFGREKVYTWKLIVTMSILNSGKTKEIKEINFSIFVLYCISADGFAQLSV